MYALAQVFQEPPLPLVWASKDPVLIESLIN